MHMQEKEGEKKIDFVKWFSELNKDSGSVAGGKGANLSEIYNLKISVPPGFVVTAQAYDYLIEKADLKDKIKELLEKIEYENTKQLNEITEEIRKLIAGSEMPKEMEEEIIEAYEHLDVRDINNIGGTALSVLKKTPEPLFVAVRSSATTEDLAEASFAGQQETFLNVKGNDDLIDSIKRCFASLFTARATYYRERKGFKHEESSVAVIVQKMVDSDKAGVVFSKNPAQKSENIIIEAVFGLGEGVVSGKITPDKYVISKELKVLDKEIANKKIAITRNSAGDKKEVKLTEKKSKSQVLKNYEIHKLSEIALNLEEHYKKPQDIEFAIEGEGIYIVQTRPITALEKRIGAEDVKELQGEVILTGLAASPGIASGKIKIIEDLKDLDKIKQGDVLVTKMTNPDMVVSMQKSAAIVTDEGGLTAHASIVSREMGIPAVVGTQEATTKLKEGEIITVNGSTGKIYKGKTSETILKEVKPVTAQTKTEIKVMVDLPSFAERAAKSEIKKVGLLRIEGIIAEAGKHPDYFLEQNKTQEYEEIIFKGVRKIAQYFEELWVRTSDIRTDEFQNLEGAPKEKEANPMLGMHGIRYGIKNPEILKAELKAMKRVSEGGKKLGVLISQLIDVNELKKVKESLKEIEFSDAKTGVMIETPSSVQSIRELCEEGIDFISFGTNDLTQYILAVDRGNEEVQYLYNEMHSAVLYQLGYVIRVCKRNKVETSICGQAGSRKEMVKFLVEQGIDSISVNADVAAEIAEYVSEIEKGLIKDTDKEPRQYKPEEKIEKPKEEQVEKNDIVKQDVSQGGVIDTKDDSEIVNDKELDIKEGIEQPVEEKPKELTEEKVEEEVEEMEENIEEIEKEKEEYVEQHPEEEAAEEAEEETEREVEEKEEEIEERKTEQVKENDIVKQDIQQGGVIDTKDDSNISEDKERIEKDIEEIEKEKEEYVEQHPEEETEEKVEEEAEEDEPEREVEEKEEEPAEKEDEVLNIF